MTLLYASLVFVLAGFSAGCNFGDRWISPSRCAIKNESPIELTDVVIDRVDLNWEPVPIALKPGETKLILLPGGKIPGGVILGHTNGDSNIRIYQQLTSIDTNYQGDILFTIMGKHGIAMKIEAVDSDKLDRLLKSESKPPSDPESED